MKRSEIILLVICVASIFFVGNAIAFKKFKIERTKQEQILVDLERRGENPRMEEAAATPAAQATVWKDRMAWLDQNLPKMESSDQAQAALLEDIRSSAKAFDLDIDGQSFVKPAKTPHYQEVAVKMNLDGPERKVYQWVAGLQSPEKFQAIKYLRLRPDGRNSRPEGDCVVVVARWIKP
jgi:hypothetical protein